MAEALRREDESFGRCSMSCGSEPGQWRPPRDSGLHPGGADGGQSQSEDQSRLSYVSIIPKLGGRVNDPCSRALGSLDLAHREV